ncbi:MAG TPA: BadF/BadG/BcrA/BcrD ATPase family protein [Terriglobales bacterium]|nr:BadF/BadG/BcrA/BcrD ATPase family protein [Terriglobales bacterium]
MAIFLGIDGGGSKTLCLIGDETSVLGSGSAGGSNFVRTGEAQAKESLAAAIRQACMVANVQPSEIISTCAGMAGVVSSETADTVRRMLAEIVPGDVEIVGDNAIALEAAFGGGPGVIVIAGTGSIAYGQNAAGETARAGGWGFAVSDEGSGQWIGRTAVSSLLRAQDEGRETNLPEVVTKQWKLNSPAQIVLAANSTPPPDFAALVPGVLAAAESGDFLAREILTRAGEELAKLAAIAARRLFGAAESVPVAMVGGVFGNSALVRQSFYNHLRAEFPHAVLQAEVVEPVRGALRLARKIASRTS